MYFYCHVFMYFNIFLVSFLITFLHPEIAMSTDRHVPCSLPQLMMSGLLWGMVVSFHMLIHLSFMTCFYRFWYILISVFDKFDSSSLSDFKVQVSTHQHHLLHHHSSSTLCVMLFLLLAARLLTQHTQKQGLNWSDLFLWVSSDYRWIRNFSGQTEYADCIREHCKRRKLVQLTHTLHTSLPTVRKCNAMLTNEILYIYITIRKGI